MLFVKLTRTGAGRYDGEMYVNALLLTWMQRVDGFTNVIFMVPSGSEDGGMEGVKVEETPEEIIALIEQATDR